MSWCKVYRSFTANSSIVKYHYMTLSIWSKDHLKGTSLHTDIPDRRCWYKTSSLAVNTPTTKEQCNIKRWKKRPWYMLFIYSVSAKLHTGKPIKTLTKACSLLTQLETSSALESRKWQPIGISWWWYHSLPEIANNWTRGAARSYTTAPISLTGLSPHSS